MVTDYKEDAMTRYRSRMTKAAPFGGTLVLGLILTAGTTQSPAPHGPGSAVVDVLPSPVQWSGPHSEVRDGRLIQVTDQKAWARLWAEHRGERAERLIAHGGGVAAPRVDFERYLVIAMFRGDTKNRDGEHLVSLEERSNDVRLRFDSYTFQTASFDGPDRGEAASSYGMWLVPRTGKPIVIEENTQGLLGAEPKWTWRRTLPAP